MELREIPSKRRDFGLELLVAVFGALPRQFENV
jgi:hypothetical protein